MSMTYNVMAVTTVTIRRPPPGLRVVAALLRSPVMVLQQTQHHMPHCSKTADKPVHGIDQHFLTCLILALEYWRKILLLWCRYQRPQLEVSSPKLNLQSILNHGSRKRVAVDSPLMNFQRLFRAVFDFNLGSAQSEIAVLTVARCFPCYWAVFHVQCLTCTVHRCTTSCKERSEKMSTVRFVKILLSFIFLITKHYF